VSGATGAPPAHAAEAEMGVGHIVLALEAGPHHTGTMGVVSARAIAGARRWANTDRYLATDVVMYPGFSGGPLVGANGRLLGLNTSGLNQGVSLAIPAATLDRVVDALRAHGRVRRGYLGVSTQRVRLPEGAAAEVGQKSGLLVVAVESGSPAETAGLTLGDTLLALSGKPIQTHEDLLAALSGEVVGQKEVARILRGGQVRSGDQNRRTELGLVVSVSDWSLVTNHT
jgi:S1-C subfamily serine protease